MGRPASNSKLQVGQKIDKLTLVSVKRVKKIYGKEKRVSNILEWHCVCDCGNTVDITEKSLLTKHCHSCGCVSKQNLIPGNIEKTIKAGKARAEKRNKDGVNVDMLFRDKPIATNTSGMQGISYAKNIGKWQVYVGYQNRRATLGYFEKLEDAKKMRILGLKAVEEGYFEEFYKQVRGKDYKETYKVDDRKIKGINNHEV